MCEFVRKEGYWIFKVLKDSSEWWLKSAEVNLHIRKDFISSKEVVHLLLGISLRFMIVRYVVIQINSIMKFMMVK